MTAAEALDRGPTRARWPHRVAVAGLVLWGLVHMIGGAALMVDDTANGLESVGGSALETIPADPGDVVAGLLRFHGINIAIGGLAVLGLTIAWRRRRALWQLNAALAIAVALDIGLLAFMVLPGVMPVGDGFIGPALVLVALIGIVPINRAVPGHAH